MSIPDLRAYGELVYSLQERYPSIQHSTLVLATIGPTLAKLEGQVVFKDDVLLDVWELIDFDAKRILNYSYEVYRSGEKISWYDPFEHPHTPELATTFPHHKHVLPDTSTPFDFAQDRGSAQRIKHNRVPAPGISFDRPNLPYLIEEIEREILPSSSSV